MERGVDMGLLDCVEQVVKVGIDVISLPVDIFDDLTSGKDRSVTIKKLETTFKDISKIPEELVR